MYIREVRHELFSDAHVPLSSNLALYSNVPPARCAVATSAREERQHCRFTSSKCFEAIFAARWLGLLPNHMCCSDILDVGLGASIIIFETLWWHSLVDFFGALAGLCHFWVSQIFMYAVKHVKKAVKEAGNALKSSPSPSPSLHYSPWTRKTKVSVMAVVSKTRLPPSCVA